MFIQDILREVIFGERSFWEFAKIRNFLKRLAENTTVDYSQKLILAIKKLDVRFAKIPINLSGKATFLERDSIGMIRDDRDRDDKRLFSLVILIHEN